KHLRPPLQYPEDSTGAAAGAQPCYLNGRHPPTFRMPVGMDGQIRLHTCEKMISELLTIKDAQGMLTPTSRGCQHRSRPPGTLRRLRLAFSSPSPTDGKNPRGITSHSLFPFRAVRREAETGCRTGRGLSYCSSPTPFRISTSRSTTTNSCRAW